MKNPRTKYLRVPLTNGVNTCYSKEDLRNGIKNQRVRDGSAEKIERT